ncbi:MAG: HD-GYP domain-containing protein [bacterium]
MSEKRPEDFTSFVQGSCVDLLQNTADTVSVSLSVLDTAGHTILEVSGPERDAGSRENPTRSLSAPIKTSEVAIGALVASTQMEMQPLLDSLAAEIGKRFELEQDINGMTEELMQAYDQLNLLYESARILRPDESFATNARRLVEDTAELLGKRLLILYLPKESGIIWPRQFDNGQNKDFAWLRDEVVPLHQVFIDLEDTLGAKQDDEAMRFQSSLTHDHGSVEFVAIPIWVRFTLRGYVGLFRGHQEISFETGEIRLVETLAEELSNAATTQELNLELRQLLFNVVRSLVAAIEAKDLYTRGHSERVVQVCVQIAERLGLPEEDIQLLSWTAILHDIGKISIEDGILNKPAKLTDEEYEVVKGHSASGAKMLEPITQLFSVLPGIRHHHERYDGRGYPDGLMGEEIPLFARIIAVADTFDAIVSARPYREAAMLERAIQVIREGSGTQFDPQMATAFLELAAKGALEPGAADVPQTVES